MSAPERLAKQRLSELVAELNFYYLVTEQEIGEVIAGAVNELEIRECLTPRRHGAKGKRKGPGGK